MVRLFGFLAGAGFVAALLFSLVFTVIGYFSEPPVKTVEEEFHLYPKANVSWSFEGPMGKYDNRQLQRGYQVYKEVCSACHSIKQVAFRDLEEIGFNKAEVKALAAEWEVPSVNPDTGEPATRKAMPSDKFPLKFPNDVAAAAANNGAIPPDLSLMSKARPDGTHYIYSLLTGYQEPSAALKKKFPDFEVPEGKHFNPYFHSLNIGMAPPLTDGSVTYADGTKSTMKQNAKDLAAFLTWTAEPNLTTRHSVGWATLLYLLVLTVLAYFAYRGVWADKKPKKK